MLEAGAMSHMPMLSLDERERRAQERKMKQEARERRQKSERGGGPSARSLRGPEPRSPPAPSPQPRMAPRSGESLFDNYANLQDPTTFSTDEEEVEELLRMGVGWKPPRGSQEEDQYLEHGWDPSPHKNPPAYLKLLKPITREPWTIDAEIYNTKFNTADFGKPTRYGIDPDPPLGQYRLEDPEKRAQGVTEAWNTQPFRQVPYSLRGIKPSPTSTEPWVEDQKNRRGDFEDNDVIENETAIQLDNGGEQAFKKGAFNAYKNERNRKLHPDAWDGSTRTW